MDHLLSKEYGSRNSHPCIPNYSDVVEKTVNPVVTIPGSVLTTMFVSEQNQLPRLIAGFFLQSPTLVS